MINLDIQQAIKYYYRFILNSYKCIHYEECNPIFGIQHTNCKTCESFKRDPTYIFNYLYENDLLKFNNQKIILTNGIMV